jgi:hypothetical protein
MGAALVPLVMVLAALVLIAVGLAAFGRRQARRRQEVLEGHTVRYPVPDWQDPAPILAALHRAGYTAVMAGATAERVVAVHVETPESREAVRSVIAGAPLNLDEDRPAPHDVRFLDD